MYKTLIRMRKYSLNDSDFEQMEDFKRRKVEQAEDYNEAQEDLAEEELILLSSRLNSWSNNCRTTGCDSPSSLNVMLCY